MKMVVSYLNFVFFIEVKAKSKYRILNFVFQFIKKTKWHFGYTDCRTMVIRRLGVVCLTGKELQELFSFKVLHFRCTKPNYFGTILVLKTPLLP